MRALVLAVALVVGVVGSVVGGQVAKTQLITAQPTTLLGGVTVNVPATTNPQSKVPQSANVFEASITLSEAEKLSTDLQITFGVYFSEDNGATWRFGNGFVWQSYGPGGLTVTDPDGTVRVNPDPRLQIGVVPYRGWHARAVIVASRSVTAGGTLQVF